MAQLATENFEAIQKRVLRMLDIDEETRRAEDKPVPIIRKREQDEQEKKDEEDEEDEVGKRAHDRHWINKAFAGELLAATLVACLDTPEKVVAPAQLDDYGRPTSFALGGEADIWAVYPGFILLVEVSTKERMSADDFRTQMDQSIRHGHPRSIEFGRPVYALVINDCDIERSEGFRRIYRSFRPAPKEDEAEKTKEGEEAEEAKKGDVRPISMENKSFVRILDTIHELGHSQDFPFDAGVMMRALQTVYDGLDPSEDESLKSGWTSTTMIDALRVQPGLRLPSPSLGT